MHKLDDQINIEKFDKGNILSSLRMVPDQMQQAWEDIGKIKIPSSFQNVTNVVICAMGGSALGGRVVDSLLVDRVGVPIEIFNDYHIPKYVNKDSLVIVSSYSGNTEETISAYKQAKDRKANIFCITSGGKLSEIIKKDKVTSYLIEPKFNPSDQPRMGIGYSISSTLSVLAKINAIQMTDDDFFESAVFMRGLIKEYDSDVTLDKNISKNIALKLYGKVPVLIAGPHLSGSSYVMKNQFNENSKVFSLLFEIPELNHHLLEGLKYPAKIREILYFIMINSDLYDKRIIERFKITSEVFEKCGFEYIEYKPLSSKKIFQIFEIVTLGSFISFYLAVLNNIDPSELPWVDYFKEKLAKL